MIEERQHGDILEHHHEGYEYWHPVTRMHKLEDGEIISLPEGHILASVVPYIEDTPAPRGLQVQNFDWESWDAGCHAPGICQGYKSIPVDDSECPFYELHHRKDYLQGIAERYWQCPHCRPLAKYIQWAQDARLEDWDLETRGKRVVLWLKVSSGQWFVLVTNGTVEGVATMAGMGAAYAVGNYPPQQLPNEIAVTLARRFWHRITKGYWSNVPKDK